MDIPTLSKKLATIRRRRDRQMKTQQELSDALESASDKNRKKCRRGLKKHTKKVEQTHADFKQLSTYLCDLKSLSVGAAEGVETSTPTRRRGRKRPRQKKTQSAVVTRTVTDAVEVEASATSMATVQHDDVDSRVTEVKNDVVDDSGSVVASRTVISTSSVTSRAESGLSSTDAINRRQSTAVTSIMRQAFKRCPKAANYLSETLDRALITASRFIDYYDGSVDGFFQEQSPEMLLEIAKASFSDGGLSVMFMAPLRSIIDLLDTLLLEKVQSQRYIYSSFYELLFVKSALFASPDAITIPGVDVDMINLLAQEDISIGMCISVDPPVANSHMVTVQLLEARKILPAYMAVHSMFDEKFIWLLPWDGEHRRRMNVSSTMEEERLDADRIRQTSTVSNWNLQSVTTVESKEVVDRTYDANGVLTSQKSTKSSRINKKQSKYTLKHQTALVRCFFCCCCACVFCFCCGASFRVFFYCCAM